MKIEDYGFVISCSKFGDGSYIVKLLSYSHGIVKGLVKGQKKNGVILQSGNLVHFVWNARLQEHLGMISVSLEKAYPLLHFNDYKKILSITSVCSLIDVLIPEREEAQEIYNKVRQYMEFLADNDWMENYVLLELFILEKTGFGLSLDMCAVTGKTEGLAYISPKTGSAVTKEVGDEYKARLFGIPAYFREKTSEMRENLGSSIQEVIDGLEITRYFLAKHFFANQLAKLPMPALQFADEILRNSQNEERENRIN